MSFSVPACHPLNLSNPVYVGFSLLWRFLRLCFRWSWRFWETLAMYMGQKWQPAPVFLPGRFHGQRRLVGYSPWRLQRIGHDWDAEHSRIAMYIVERPSIGICLMFFSSLVWSYGIWGGRSQVKSHAEHIMSGCMHPVSMTEPLLLLTRNNSSPLLYFSNNPLKYSLSGFYTVTLVFKN